MTDKCDIFVGYKLLVTEDLKEYTWLVWQTFKTAYVSELYVVDGKLEAEIREGDTGRGSYGQGRVPIALVKKLRRAWLESRGNESGSIDAADIVIPSITGESLTNAEIYIYHDNGDDEDES